MCSWCSGEQRCCYPYGLVQKSVWVIRPCCHLYATQFLKGNATYYSTHVIPRSQLWLLERILLLRKDPSSSVDVFSSASQWLPLILMVAPGPGLPDIICKTWGFTIFGRSLALIRVGAHDIHGDLGLLSLKKRRSRGDEESRAVPGWWDVVEVGHLYLFGLAGAQGWRGWLWK